MPIAKQTSPYQYFPLMVLVIPNCRKGMYKLKPVQTHCSFHFVGCLVFMSILVWARYACLPAWFRKTLVFINYFKEGYLLNLVSYLFSRVPKQRLHSSPHCVHFSLLYKNWWSFFPFFPGKINFLLFSSELSSVVELALSVTLVSDQRSFCDDLEDEQCFLIPVPGCFSLLSTTRRCIWKRHLQVFTH